MTVTEECETNMLKEQSFIHLTSYIHANGNTKNQVMKLHFAVFDNIVSLFEFEEFRKQTDYISIVFIHTESAHAGALVLVSLHLP